MSLGDAVEHRGDVAGSSRVSASIRLKSSEFRRTREQSWRDLESIVATVENRGVRALRPDELERMPLLYRTALSSLSVARTIALDRNLLLYLENLALRAFLAVYGPRTGMIEGVRQFLGGGFATAVRAARWHFVIALATMLVGCAAGAILTAQDESWFSTFVPSWLAGGRGPGSPRDALLNGELFAPWPGPLTAIAVVANFLFTNNTIVGILTFSLGVAAGVPTLLLLVYQGLTLGAFLALHYDRGLTTEFLGWVLIHGVTEIGAILLCGAAGLLVAEKILFPDRYSRLDSLAIHGRQAAEVTVGAMLMFFVAAILEGFFRQLVASTPGRFAIAAATGACWLVYFVRSGRRTP